MKNLLKAFAYFFVSTGFHVVHSDEIIFNGFEEVFIADINTTSGDAGPKIWSWIAEKSTSLPSHMKTKFGTTDESKPVRGGLDILITASSGGVALVNRQSQEVLFYGTVSNAHSADLLPNNRIAVAGSIGNDRLFLFEQDRPETVLYTVDCEHCHGVVWDEERDVLYALNDAAILIYELVDWETTTPSLNEIDNIPLPATGGHDMLPIPGTANMSVSTSQNVWIFDRDKKTVVPHPDIPNVTNVKSVNHHPLTNQIMYTRGTSGFATREIQFLNPDLTVNYQDELLYKVRWNIEPPVNIRHASNNHKFSFKIISSPISSIHFPNSTQWVDVFNLSGKKQLSIHKDIVNNTSPSPYFSGTQLYILKFRP